MKKNDKATAPATDKKQPSLRHDSRGLSSVEYLILLVVIAVASIGIWKQIGGKIQGHAETSRDSIGDLSVTR